MSEYFLTTIANDPKIGERFSAACAVMQGQLLDQGVHLSLEDIKTNIEALPAIKLACLTEIGLEVETALKEIWKLPSVSDQARRAKLKSALEAGQAKAVAEIYSMPREQRLEAGRKIAAEATKAKTAPLSAEEEAFKIGLLRGVADRGERLALARSWGLA